MRTHRWTPNWSNPVTSSSSVPSAPSSSELSCSSYALLRCEDGGALVREGGRARGLLAPFVLASVTFLGSAGILSEDESESAPDDPPRDTGVGRRMVNETLFFSSATNFLKTVEYFAE